MSDITEVTFREFLRRPKECLEKVPLKVVCRDRESFYVVREYPIDQPPGLFPQSGPVEDRPMVYCQHNTPKVVCMKGCKLK